VTPDVAGAVRNAKAGQVRFRADKAGVIHCAIGKASFEREGVKENLQALLHDLQRVKPAASKGFISSASRCPRRWDRACRSTRPASAEPRRRSLFRLMLAGRGRAARWARNPGRPSS
jgi:hypothetical protein